MKKKQSGWVVFARFPIRHTLTVWSRSSYVEYRIDGGPKRIAR